MKTYDFSGFPLSPHNDERLTKLVKGQPVDQTVLDCILVALEMPVEEREKNSEADLNFRRKIVRKLKEAKAADKANAVDLKSKAVEEIKKRVSAYFVSGVAMQILDAIEGEPTQAQLDDI